MGIMIKELSTQLCLSLRGLSHNKQSTGVLINTMNQSDTRVVGIIARQVAQMPRYGIDQRTVEITNSWMNHHTCRFVNYHQLVILIDNIQRYFLWFDGCVVMRAVEHQGNDITWTNLVIALDGRSVYLYETCISCFLDSIARGVRKMLRHILVDADRHLTMIHLHAQMLIELTVRRLFHVIH